LILSNKKPIDASSFWQKMRKSLVSKRKEVSDAHSITGQINGRAAVLQNVAFKATIVAQ
jgi:hypothetical protein